MIFSIDGLAQWAKKLAPLLRPGRPLFLSGPLGVGKTTLARAIIACHHQGPVLSPSFPIMLPYPWAHNQTLWHIDLYRITEKEEMISLGLLEVIHNHCCLIEWPERLCDYDFFSYTRLCLAFTAQEEKRNMRFFHHVHEKA